MKNREQALSFYTWVREQLARVTNYEARWRLYLQGGVDGLDWVIEHVNLSPAARELVEQKRDELKEQVRE